MFRPNYITTSVPPFLWLILPNFWLNMKPILQDLVIKPLNWIYPPVNYYLSFFTSSLSFFFFFWLFFLMAYTHIFKGTLISMLIIFSSSSSYALILFTQITTAYGIYVLWLLWTCCARMTKNRYFLKKEKNRFVTALDLN